MFRVFLFLLTAGFAAVNLGLYAWHHSPFSLAVAAFCAFSAAFQGALIVRHP